MIRRMSILLAAAIGTAACTETPDSFPPCVDPNDPCMLDAGDGATTDGNTVAADVTVAPDGAGGDGAATLDGARVEGGAVDAALE